MGFYSPFPFPDFNFGATRKRKFYELDNPTDTTAGLPPMDLNVPNNVPVPITPPVPVARAGRSKLDVLANILQAAASGIGVGISENPGQALMQQLAQQRQQQTERERITAEKELQAQQQYFQQAMQQSQQKAESERQKAGFGQQTSERLGAQQFAGQESKEKFGQQKEIQKADIEARLNLEKLAQEWKTNEGVKDKDFQMELLKAQQTGNLEKVQQQAMFGALFHAVGKGHLSMGAVINIMNKLNNNEQLDAGDSAQVTNAIKSQAKSAGTGIAYKSTLEEKTAAKDTSSYWNERQKFFGSYLNKATEPVMDPLTGQPVRDFNGKVQYHQDLNQLPQDVQRIQQLYDKFNPPPQSREVQQSGAGKKRASPEAVVNQLLKTNDAYKVDKMIDESQATPEEKAAMKSHLRKYTPLR
jgi:hypothetical protein